MNSQPDTTRERNAYMQARRIVPGCQHQLGCKCDPPAWLRPATQAELEFEQRFKPPKR